MDDKIIPLGSFVPYFYSPDNDSFSMQIGGTVYEVTTHFDTDGRETACELYTLFLLEEAALPRNAAVDIRKLEEQYEDKSYRNVGN